MFLICRRCGSFSSQKRRRADILQADGVQHSRGSFPQARRRIADHRLARQALYHKAAKLAQVDDVFEFNAVAESAAGGDDRILELDAGDVHTEIGGVLAHRSFSPALGPRCGGSDGLGQHAADGMRWSVDAQQGCKRRGQIDRFAFSAIGSRLKRQAVKRQRHVRIVGVGRAVIRALG